MALPTFSEVMDDQLSPSVDWLQELDELANADANNLLALEDTFRSQTKGDFTPNALRALEDDRRKLSQVLTPSNVRRRLIGFILELGRVIGKPGRDPNRVIREVIDFMNDAGTTVQSRDIVHGSPVADGGNTGTGILYRNVIDKSANELESVFTEAKRLEIVRDQGSLPRHNEEFEFQGSTFLKDFLDVEGSGQSVSLVGVSARQSEQFVSNPSWDRHDAAVDDTAPTVLNDWTADDLTSLRMRLFSSGLTFRGSEGVPSPSALEFTADNKVSQILRDVVNPRFRTDRPYFTGCQVRRRGNATGNVTLRIGNSSVVVSLASLVNDVYTPLTIAINEDSWFENFTADNMTVEVEVDTLAVGTVIVDDLITWPFKFIDGTFWIAVGGATPWLLTDFFTLTDAFNTVDSVINKFFWRGGFPSLPSTTGAPTFPDP